MARKYGHPVGQSKQAGQAFVLGGDVTASKVRTANVADQQRIARQYHRRLGTAQRAYYQDPNHLRAAACRLQDPEAQLPQLQLLVVAQRMKREGRLRRFVEAELGPILRRQAARAGEMIGMNVRIDDVLQMKAALVEQPIVRLRLERRIDDRRIVRLARGDD